MTAVADRPRRTRTPQAALRPPETVMRLERIGSFHQTRLSFMRSLLRRIAREGWTLSRERLELDGAGIGVVVYAVATPGGVVRLVGFGHDLPREQRTDRVIAERWDATFALTTAEADGTTIERLRANVPLQEAGRCSAAEYVLSRANKSVRLFDHVVESLASGRQPDPEVVVNVGYLMRTTAVYGNGKFGLSDLANTFAGGVFSRPFEAEMLTVYLIREFTFDLVEHLARVRAPGSAIALAPATKRMFGIGNATGLGMAPFLISHPVLIDRWMTARETAIARVRTLERAEPGRVARFHELLERAIQHLGEWRTDDTRQMARIVDLRRELPGFRVWLDRNGSDLLGSPHPWERIAREAAARLSTEGQELIHSLILEPHGDLVDDLEDEMAADEAIDLDPVMRLDALQRLIETRYDWALAVDYGNPAQQHLFWYVSEEKLEPRLGERFKEPGAEQELRIGIGREVKQLHGALERALQREPTASVAEFLLRAPAYRHSVRRVQALAHRPYGEIRDNLLGRDIVPIDLLRCKLSMFGAIKFDPKSDRWTRITMYQGAPCFDELDPVNADDWAFPVFLREARSPRPPGP
ncbi:MAG: hypothetical protein ACE5GS_04085 [Kiloniellaceae bacterium]